MSLCVGVGDACVFERVNVIVLLQYTKAKRWMCKQNIIYKQYNFFLHVTWKCYLL